MKTQPCSLAHPCFRLRGGAPILVALSLFAPVLRAEVVDTDANPSASKEVVSLDPYQVTGTMADGYLVNSTSTGAKGDLRPDEIPQHLSAVPAAVIEDQALRTVTEAMKDVAGVYNSYPDYYALDYMSSAYIRGFTVSATLRDGLWDPTPFGNSWLGDVEQIEVLKGPAGLLYGAYSGDIGGVINVVTKKPEKRNFLKLVGTTDSHGSRTISGDLNLALNARKTWLLRVNASAGAAEGFADRTTARNTDASAVLQGKLSTDDTLTLAYEKRWQETRPYSGLPGYAKKGSGSSAYLVWLGDYDSSLNVYDPRSNWTYTSDTARLGYEHRFNPNWLLRLNTHYSETARNVRSITASPSFLSDGSVKWTESYSEIHMGPTETIDSDLLLQGGFETGLLRHKVVVGERFTRETYAMNMSAPTTSFSTYSFTSLYAPNWYQPIVGLHRSIYGDANIHQYNTYANDVITLLPGLRLSGGINFVQYNVFSESGMSPASESGSGLTDHGHGERVGLLYDLRPGVTLFGDVATTFKPQSPTTTTDGQILTFDPLRGVQQEVGVKVNVQKSASFTASLYQIDLSNVLASDPDPTRSALGYQVETGKQRSRGLELDGSVKLTQNWILLAAYSNSLAKYISSTSYLVGSRVPNVPRNALRLWTQYELKQGTFSGLSFGLGSNSVSSRTTNVVAASTPLLVAKLPGYTVFDAMLAYRIGNARLALNLNNLLNHAYWASASSYTWLYRGEARRVQVSLGYTF